MLETSNHITKTAEASWADSVTGTECTLHQLSPYIGKLKSSISKSLILEHTKPGDLIVDPFCGAGTVALEAHIAGRRSFSSDISAYAVTLTRGKLAFPVDINLALARLDKLMASAKQRSIPDLRKVPQWVRRFFHPQTLKETLQLRDECVARRDHFLLSCLLGILHHQRPGFLSYPSSHLVPYLRAKRFPREDFPELYTYRDPYSRLRSKVKRAYRRVPNSLTSVSRCNVVRRSSIQNVTLPDKVDAIITSPPYMNALDYDRDNRLRLWLLEGGYDPQRNVNSAARLAVFRKAMVSFAAKAASAIRPGGAVVLVVGERIQRSATAMHPSDTVRDAMLVDGKSFLLEEVTQDNIPDVRRSRRSARGIKRENILLFRRLG